MFGECSIESKDAGVTFASDFLRDGAVFGVLSQLCEQRKPTLFRVRFQGTAVTAVDGLLVSLDQQRERMASTNCSVHSRAIADWERHANHSFDVARGTGSREMAQQSVAHARPML